MRKNILFITSCLLATTTFAENINTLPKDTTKVIDIEEVVVIASPKETGNSLQPYLYSPKKICKQTKSQL